MYENMPRTLGNFGYLYNYFRTWKLEAIMQKFKIVTVERNVKFMKMLLPVTLSQHLFINLQFHWLLLGL